MSNTNQFQGNARVKVCFHEGKMYFRTKEGYACATSSLRRHLRSGSNHFNDECYPWSCTYSHAEDLLRLNASLKVSDGEVKYLNDKPEHFYQIQGSNKVYKKLSKACIKAFVKNKGQLDHMITNCKSVYTNMLGYAIPVLSYGHLFMWGGNENRIGVEDFSEEDMRTILKYALELKDDMSLSGYDRDWIQNNFIPALNSYLEGLKMSNEEIEKSLKEYGDVVEKVNETLKKHSDEFEFSDEGSYGFDCGFLTIGFADEKLKKQNALLANDSRTKYRIPSVRLPKSVQSLTVQRREFKKAKRIVKNELDIELVILSAELD